MFSWIPSHSQPWLKVFWFSGHSFFKQMSSFNCYCLASAFLTATTKARTIKVPVFLAGDASSKWFTLETVRKFARNSCTCHTERTMMCCFDLNTLMEQQIGENTRGFCFIFPDKKIVTCFACLCSDTFTSNKNGASRSIPDFWALAGKFWKELKVSFSAPKWL